jgi:hypothetical protein
LVTTYAGTQYRSRLEARWSAFFTRIGWHHTYEPFDGDGYIPDFVIHGDRPMLVEIKPAVTRADYFAPIEKITTSLADHWPHDVLVCGADPLPYWSTETSPTRDGDPDENPGAGLLGEWDDWGDGGWCFDEGLWCTCTICGAISVLHAVQSFVSRPCGHYDGGSYMSPLYPGIVRAHWAAACNDVKWPGRHRI